MDEKIDALASEIEAYINENPFDGGPAEATGKDAMDLLSEARQLLLEIKGLVGRGNVG